MPAELARRDANLERADASLAEASRAGAQLAVLPEMFNTGYGLLPDYAPHAEETDGPTLRHLSSRSRQWRMGIVAGFVEREGRHFYDALVVCLPDGSVQIYRKRHLVFWERFRFRPGRCPLVVSTPWGRIGLAICADMIYRDVWDDYRGRIDLGVIASAWLRLPPQRAQELAIRPHRPAGGRDPGQGRTGSRHPRHLRQSVRCDLHDDPDARPATDPADRGSVRRP
jgi:N-carbamoylputrescine amidase